MSSNFRVRAGSIEFLDPNDKVRSTRPATEQEQDMWHSLSGAEMDLNSANQSNEAYRAQLERLFSGMRALGIGIHPVEDAVSRVLVDHERVLSYNKALSAEHKKLVDWAKAVANFQDGQGHSVVDLLINMLSNAYGPTTQGDLTVPHPKEVSQADLFKGRLEYAGEVVDTDTLRWDSESPAHHDGDAPRLPRNPKPGTVAEVNGAKMVYDGNEWRAMPVPVADPAGDSDPHWSDTTHD